MVLVGGMESRKFFVKWGETATCLCARNKLEESQSSNPLSGCTNHYSRHSGKQDWQCLCLHFSWRMMCVCVWKEDNEQINKQTKNTKWIHIRVILTNQAICSTPSEALPSTPKGIFSLVFLRHLWVWRLTPALWFINLGEPKLQVKVISG